MIDIVDALYLPYGFENVQSYCKSRRSLSRTTFPLGQIKKYLSCLLEKAVPFGKIAFLSIKKGLKMVLVGFPDKKYFGF